MASQPASAQSPPRPGHSRASSMPSPMSLHRRGILSPLSPFRRPFLSSPQHSHYGLPHHEDMNIIQGAGTDTDDEDFSSPVEPSDEDRTEDSKNVLVDRLNDILRRLAQDDQSHGADIAAMHVYVDRMEEHLPRPVYALSKSQTISSRPSSSAVAEGSRQHEHLPLLPLSVARSEFARMSDISALSPSDLPTRPQHRLRHDGLVRKPTSGLPRDVAAQVADEAEKLRGELAGLTESIKQRDEEFLWMTDTFIAKAKELMNRVSELEGDVANLEAEVTGLNEDMEEQESDVFNLRLQLKGIEAACQDHISESSDTQLVESIKNWHSDYRTLQHKWALKKQHRDGTSPSRDTTKSSPPPSTSPSLRLPAPISPQPNTSPTPPVTVRKVPRKAPTSSDANSR